MEEVQAAGVCGGAKLRSQGRIAEVSVHCGSDGSDGGLAAPEVLPNPSHEVVREGGDLDLPLLVGRGDEVPHLLGCHRLHDPDRPSTDGLPGELRGAENGGLGRDVLVNRLVGDITPGGAPDPPGIQQLGSTAATSTEKPAHTTPASPTAAEGEDVRSLHEEGALLLVAGLEGGEVHHGRVHLYLPEIGIHRGVQREIGADTVLQIHPHAVEEIRAVSIGVVEPSVRVLVDFDHFSTALDIGE